MAKPSIKVSEISRVLVNLRKAILKEQKPYGIMLGNDYLLGSLKTIEQVRRKLELRKRSRG